MPALREGRAQWVLKTSSSPLAEPSSAREADRLLPEGHQAVTTPATQYAVLQGFLTGATGLEPATSGVTGRVGYSNAQRRTALNYVICRCCGAPAATVSHG